MAQISEKPIHSPTNTFKDNLFLFKIQFLHGKGFELNISPVGIKNSANFARLKSPIHGAHHILYTYTQLNPHIFWNFIQKNSDKERR